MQKLIVFIICMLILSPFAFSAERPDYNFKVYVIGDGSDKDVDVYGTFNAEEGRYGGIELVFFYDTYSFSIRSIENIEDLLVEPMDSDVDFDSKNIEMIIRLFVKPMMAEDGKIRLTGQLQNLANSRKNGDPLFTLKKEKVDLTLENWGKNLFTVLSPNSSRKYEFELEMNTQKDNDQFSKIDDVAFEASYSLFDESTEEYAVKDAKCKLKPIKNMQKDDLICSHYMTFQLPNGDSLLYLVAYNLEDIYKTDNGAFNLTFAVKRYYYQNPRTFFDQTSKFKNHNLPYSQGSRKIEQTININGNSRKIAATIEDGEVIAFQWDNINLLPIDIVRNWTDIVSILKKIDDNKYDYIPPEVSRKSVAAASIQIDGLLNSPDNFTGDKIKTTAYSKSITVYPGERTELTIPFSDNLLPFPAIESIVLNFSDEFIQVDEPPELIYEEIPIYPEQSKQNNITGEVYVKVFVNKRGGVTSAYVLKCDNPGHGFEDAALEAAYKNKFKPAMKDGQPVAVWVTYLVIFDF